MKVLYALTHFEIALFNRENIGSVQTEVIEVCLQIESTREIPTS